MRNGKYMNQIFELESDVSCFHATIIVSVKMSRYNYKRWQAGAGGTARRDEADPSFLKIQTDLYYMSL